MGFCPEESGEQSPVMMAVTAKYDRGGHRISESNQQCDDGDDAEYAPFKTMACPRVLRIHRDGLCMLRFLLSNGYVTTIAGE